MISNGDNTFKKGNSFGKGRQKYSQNKSLLELQRIGEENCLSLYELQTEIAKNGKDENVRSQAQQFLINKVLPNAKGGRFITLSLLPLEGLESIKKNQELIMKNVCDGCITLEEGERLYALTDQHRKIIEACDLSQKVEEMNQRMKEAGL